jgi:hypothetical protein
MALPASAAAMHHPQPGGFHTGPGGLTQRERRLSMGSLYSAHASLLATDSMLLGTRRPRPHKIWKKKYIKARACVLESGGDGSSGSTASYCCPRFCTHALRCELPNLSADSLTHLATHRCFKTAAHGGGRLGPGQDHPRQGAHVNPWGTPSRECESCNSRSNMQPL